MPKTRHVRGVASVAPRDADPQLMSNSGCNADGIANEKRIEQSTATEVPGRNHNNDKRELTNGYSTAILLPAAALGLGYTIERHAGVADEWKNE